MKYNDEQLNNQASKYIGKVFVDQVEIICFWILSLILFYMYFYYLHNEV